MDHDADLAEHLNDAGLLSDLSYAERLMEKANETGYGEGLFACIRILAQVMYSSDVTGGRNPGGALSEVLGTHPRSR